MNKEEQEIADKAYFHISRTEIVNIIISKYASLDRFVPASQPVSVFMSGCPGAGKTEFSKALIKERGNDAVRIDPDELRNELPQYTGDNSHLFQRAVSFGTDKLFNHALKYKQNLVLDGTLKNYENIQRSLDKNRFVSIYYIYQNPLVAWNFTKKREDLEHRHINKDTFIESFFLSKENANKLKGVFGKSIELNLVVKDDINKLKRYKLNITNIDSYIKDSYNEKDLVRLLV